MTHTIKDIVRATALRSHYHFGRAAFKWAYRKSMLDAFHFHLICDAVDRVLRGEITRLNINMPPRHGKTEWLVVLLYARLYAVNPAARSMHLSYSDPLVRKNSRKIKNVFSTPQFGMFFPELVLSNDSYAQNHWETTVGGEFHAVTPWSSMTGFECGGDDDPWDGVMVIDDAQKAGTIRQAPERNKAIEGVHEAVTTRLNHDRTPVIHIQQRLHQKDVTDFLLSGGTGDIWHTLVLQGEAYDDEVPESYKQYRFCELLEYEGRPPGALWPQRRGLEFLHKIRDAAPTDDEENARGLIAYETQYQQTPASTSLAMYKPAWLPTYEELPWSLSEITMRVDTAQKGRENSDYHGVLILGHDKRDQNKTYILDADQKRLEFPELVDWVMEHIERISLKENNTINFTRIIIEDANVGDALAATLRLKIEESHFINVSVVLTPKYGSKFDRAMEAVPFYQKGNFVVPANETSWMDEDGMAGVKALVKQFKEFNEADTHASDDILDCLGWEAVQKYGRCPDDYGFVYSGIQV